MGMWEEALLLMGLSMWTTSWGFLLYLEEWNVAGFCSSSLCLESIYRENPNSKWDGKLLKRWNNPCCFCSNSYQKILLFASSILLGPVVFKWLKNPDFYIPVLELHNTVSIIVLITRELDAFISLTLLNFVFSGSWFTLRLQSLNVPRTLNFPRDSCIKSRVT